MASFFLGSPVDSRSEPISTPTRLRLFSPVRSWLVLNTIVAAGLTSAALYFYHSYHETHRELLRVQAETLAHSSGDRIAAGRFRDVVESLGPSFRESWLRLSSRGTIYEYGTRVDHADCHSVRLSGLESSRETGLTLCSGFRFPVFPFLFLGLVFLLASGLSFWRLQVLESDSTKRLVGFFSRLGVQASSVSGLSGILKEIGELQDRVIQAKNREIEMGKAEAVAKVAAQVAHDIRSPVSALLVAKHSLRITHPEEVELISVAASRIQDMASELIRVHRGASHRELCREKEEWVLSKALVELIAEKRSEYVARSSLRFELEMELPQELKVNWNRADLARVLSNLLNNATEASGYRGEVCCEVRRFDPRFLEISIVDSGIGFSEEQRDLFLNGDRLFSTRSAGLGLGLAFAREFVEKEGGSIGIANRLGRPGAVVRLRLPVLDCS